VAEPSTILDTTARVPLIGRRFEFATKLRPGLVVIAVAAILSISSFGYFLSNGMTNVYGDGVAHVNIARKVVDSPDQSVWQRYIQIGSPWLPLQTVAMLPLVANDWMWRTGAAGSFVSMLSFVIATFSLYSLARSFYRGQSGFGEALALLSAAIFAFNPSLLYMQTTPMSEVVLMASLVTAVYFLQRWVSEPSGRRLAAAALAMSLATLARYEAWPVAALSILVVALTSTGGPTARIKTAAQYSAITALGPAYWLWHNWAIYSNAFEFLTGPNSARGLYLQNQANLGWSKIFVGNAALDFVTIAAAVAACAGPLIWLLGGAGFLRWLVVRRKYLISQSPALLLLVPFLFHVLSLYRGEIQVFPLSAFGTHNLRYGLPHLLAVALFGPSAVLLFKETARRPALIAACAIIALQYTYLISEGPSQLAVYQEAYRSGVNARAARERSKIASFVESHPPDGLVLMHTGALGPVVSRGGLRFSRVIHEGSARWHKLDTGIPNDVTMVIVQKGDPLDARFNEDAALARDLEEQFREEVIVGGIRVFLRRRKLN
jgi:hypothetical protein